MELGHAYSVLVVSASAKFNESVRGLLPERFYWPVTVLTDAAGQMCIRVSRRCPPGAAGKQLRSGGDQHAAAG